MPAASTACPELLHGSPIPRDSAAGSAAMAAAIGDSFWLWIFTFWNLTGSDLRICFNSLWIVIFLNTVHCTNLTFLALWSWIRTDLRWVLFSAVLSWLTGDEHVRIARCFAPDWIFGRWLSSKLSQRWSDLARKKGTNRALFFLFLCATVVTCGTVWVRQQAESKRALGVLVLTLLVVALESPAMYCWCWCSCCQLWFFTFGSSWRQLQSCVPCCKGQDAQLGVPWRSRYPNPLRSYPLGPSTTGFPARVSLLIGMQLKFGGRLLSFSRCPVTVTICLCSFCCCHQLLLARKYRDRYFGQGRRSERGPAIGRGFHCWSVEGGRGRGRDGAG